MPICGGISENAEPATSDVHALIQQVKSEVTGKMNASFDVFEAISYKSQVVAGRNYFVKVRNFNKYKIMNEYNNKTFGLFQVHVGDDKCIHVRIYKNLQQEVSVHSVEDNKTREDPITYF